MGEAAQHHHVLVINDSQPTLDLLRDILEEGGYRVSVSMETLQMLHIRELAPDIIVQDLSLAGTKGMGWKFLTLARLDPVVACIPLVLCTAALETVTAREMAENLDRLGVRVLFKPFDLDDLLAAVAGSLTAQRLINQVREREPADEI